MEITKQWLLNNSEKFWCDLFWIIHETSPYFGRLTWKLRPGIGLWPFFRLEWPLGSIRETIREVIPDNANEEQILRLLMSIIFWVTQDYDRNRIVIPEREYNEEDREWMRQQGLEKLPRYPGYFVTLVPSDNRRDNYRALKLEEITEEDIKEFKKKVKLFGVPYSEKLLAGYWRLKNYYRERENQVKQKLINWRQLIINRHV